jgi:2-polyprenyl-3-methyl-5-hydroxy-6-metoxy-1,4-benzoquinol methylase
MAIQKKHKEPRKKYDPFKAAKKNYESETKAYIKRAISMYRELAANYKPFSAEEIICREEMFKFTVDLEVLEHGAYEERKEVVKKYGRGIS